MKPRFLAVLAILIAGCSNQTAVPNPGPASRPAPHNLYTTLDQLKQGVAKSGQTVTYEAPKNGEPSGQGDPVTKFSFQQTPSHSVSYTYSGDAYTYSYEAGALND